MEGPWGLDVVAEALVAEAAGVAGAGMAKCTLGHVSVECGHTAGEALAAVAGRRKTVGTLVEMLG